MSIHPFSVTGNLTNDKGAANCRATRYKAMSGCQRPKTIPGNRPRKRIGMLWQLKISSLRFARFPFVEPLNFSLFARTERPYQTCQHSRLTLGENQRVALREEKVIGPIASVLEPHD